MAGQTVSENLALCCGHCNRRKGPNIAGVDIETRSIARLFHPRIDRWDEHFLWEEVRIVGMTPAGRTTVSVLLMNHDDQLAVREELTATGWMPESHTA